MQLQDQSSLEYVMHSGTPWERWRAQRLMGLQLPLPPGWAEKQNPDGGWRSREFRSPLSNMGTTSVTLMRMVHAGISESEECRRTVEYLWQTQQADGRWTEDLALRDQKPPEWNQPGNLATDLWETANNAACLAALGFRHNRRIDKAVAWLTGYAREDGAFPGYLATTQAMAALCALRGEQEDAQRYLGSALLSLRQFRLAAWFDVMDLTWGLILWRLAGVAPENATFAAYLAELKGRRKADGTWSSRYPGCDAQYTLEALEILHAVDGPANRGV